MRPSKIFHDDQDDCDVVLPEMASGKRPTHLEIFHEAVNAIAGAAKKFKDVTGDGEEGQQSYLSTNEDNPHSAKLPVAAYCLRLAHQIWRESHPMNQDDLDEDGAGYPPAGHPLAFMGRIGAPGGGHEVSPEVAINFIAETMSPEQRSTVIGNLQKMNNNEVPPTKVLTDEQPAAE